MHVALLQFVPILGAEKSKVAFYIAGGVLVCWALVVSLGLGLRRPGFPGSPSGQRVVMALSAALVIATVSTAVITAGGSTNAVAGSSGHAPASGVPSALLLTADPGGQFKYASNQLSAKAGTVTIDFANMSPLMHNTTIAQGSKVLGATPTFNGGTRALTLNLKPGTYTFYCSVPGHRQAGMEGTLSVS
jgi:plastocyanin